MDAVPGFLALAAIIWIAFWLMKAQDKQANLGADKILCPHCQERGHVRVSIVHRKRGISGGKATGALLTGGVSMLATGLSRHQKFRHMRCGNCHMEWDVE